MLLLMNGHFADTVRYPPKSYKGIVALQMRNHAEVLDQLMARLTSTLRLSHPALAKDAHLRSSQWVTPGATGVV